MCCGVSYMVKPLKETYIRSYYVNYIKDTKNMLRQIRAAIEECESNIDYDFEIGYEIDESPEMDELAAIYDGLYATLEAYDSVRERFGY